MDLYRRRTRSDGTSDSICLQCFQTVFSAGPEADLTEAESQHRCFDDTAPAPSSLLRRFQD